MKASQNLMRNFERMQAATILSGFGKFSKPYFAAATLLSRRCFNCKSRNAQRSGITATGEQMEGEKEDTVTPPITSWPVHLSPKRLFRFLGRVPNVHLALRIFEYAGKYHAGYHHTNQTYYRIIEKLIRAKEFEMLPRVLEQLQKEEFQIREELFMLIIRGYGFSNRPEDAIKTFTEINSFKSSRSVKSFNTLLNSLLQSKNYDRVSSLFRGCTKFGIVPNVFSYNILLRSVCKLGNLEEAWQVFDEMPRKSCVPNEATHVALLEAHCRLGDMVGAMRVFEMISRKNWILDSVSYSVLIGGYCKKGQLSEALKLVDHMKKKRVETDDSAYSVLIEAFCNSGRLKEAEALLNEVTNRKRHFLQSTRVCGLVIEGLCEEGRLEDAMVLWRKLLKRNCMPDCSIYNIFLHWFCKKRDLASARKLFNEMGKNNTIDVSSYNILIRGLCERGELQEVCKLWDNMLDRRISPNEISYGLLIHGFYHAGKPEEGIHILGEMINQGFSPEASVYRKLFLGLSGSARRTEALKLLQSVSGRKDFPYSEVYSFLVKEFLEVRPKNST